MRWVFSATVCRGIDDGRSHMKTAKKKRSKSPWGYYPTCQTERARRNWDWTGAMKRKQKEKVSG